MPVARRPALEPRPTAQVTATTLGHQSTAEERWTSSDDKDLAPRQSTRRPDHIAQIDQTQLFDHHIRMVMGRAMEVAVGTRPIQSHEITTTS